MKKLLFLVLLLSAFFGQAQYTAIPDANFEKALIDLGIDGASDGRVLTSSISIITTLNIKNKGIQDLTGIQDFVALDVLNCCENDLTTLDLSKNINLTNISCFNNKLNSLDISSNTNLKSLHCYSNKILSLDVSKNTAINVLTCQQNQISVLDVSKNINLTSLDCNKNQLTSLEVSKNTALINLYFNNNQITSIDISKNIALDSFNCNSNLLSNLDLSANTNLTYLFCKNNQLLSLDVSKNPNIKGLNCNNNQLTNLNLKNGQNTKFLHIYADFKSNPNLQCVQVDNKVYSDTNWSSFKDATASYSENCSKTSATIAPPVIMATGNQTYCPATSLKIVETISITNDPAEPDTDAIYIQISSGYANGQDQLTLANPTAHPTIITSWDSTAGKLKLYSSTGAKILYTDFVSAIKDVEFSNSSSNPTGIRNFSITIGLANFLPSTGHYYQFISNVGITWTAAKTAAEALDYYGIKGYLATLVTAEEAQLSGKQAVGNGWIGGNDVATEGDWKWVTGPEGLANGGTGISFWSGLANGSVTPPNFFAFWNTNEPNDAGAAFASENYAHITAPGVGNPGSWNDLPNIGGNNQYSSQGYVVEYGGMLGDPTLQISASTKITMSQLTITTPSTICGSEKTTLQATTAAGTINWYDAAIGGTLLQTGNSYTTPPLTTTTTYYVDNGCSVRSPITVNVNPLPIINPVVIPRQCDNDQDGIFVFDTTSLESTLLNGLTNVKVTYVDILNNPLKDSNGKLITSPFPASFSTKSQIITAVVTENTALSCANKMAIPFFVDDLPEAFTVPIALTTACDDEPVPANQDGKFPFNTSTLEATILGGQTGMKVSYTDQNGNPLSSPLPNPFVTGTQKISVKVENTLNTICTATTTLPFVVNQLPIVNDVTIVQCDSDLVVDGKTLFNLTVKNPEISSNFKNETFHYHKTYNGAINAIAADLIPNPLAFQNTTPTQMDVWSRISNTLTGCSSVAKITLKVPATNIPPTYKIPFAPVCDDFLDVNGNNNTNNNKRDGITSFDFSSTEAIILAKLPTNQTYTIKYYKNESDALAELNFIPDIVNYRNIGYPNSQDIWIRIDSDIDNACYGLGPYLTLKVEVLPFANTITIPRKCDDNQDGVYTFDTSTLEKDLLKGQSNVTVTYFDQKNNPLPSPFPAIFATTSQTIKAVVTNKTTQKCYDETNIAFIVDVLPQAFSIAPTLTITCDDEPEPINQDGKFAFDTSSFQSTILGTQTGMVVKYFDQNNTPLPSPLPNPFITKTQTVTAKVENALNAICTASTLLNFVVNPVPNIDLNTDGSDNELVCSNLSTFFVTLDAGIFDSSPTSNYSYLWTKDGQTIGANSPTLDVNTEGIYTVEVTNGLGCSRIRTITVTASNIATIVSIDVIDLSDVNTVTVNLTGPGDYQFSLDEPSGFWQDSNFFNNVPAGIHEVYVNDKNGCGTVQQEIVITGVPKFFTPNGDTYNDVWEIKGVSKYPQAEIQIFDRYGKYLTTLNASNNSWNGMYNGAPLSADDYWFILNLGDGKPEIKGHFSLKR